MDFTFKTKPFKHQIEGFNFGMRHDKFLLADEQGLGKTKQVIDIAIANKLDFNYQHCLIICGVNGLKWNWEKEITIHSNEKSWILGTRRLKNGKKVIGSIKERLKDLENISELFDRYFLITNVETLRDKDIQKTLKNLCDKDIISMIAIDEIHKCKNPNSQQGKSILKLFAKSQIAMTGTPIMNSPLDLYIPLKWLGFEKYSFYIYKNHYCRMGGFGNHQIVGYKNMPELHSRLDKIMLRRLKKNALDLPDKIYITEYVEMTTKQSKIYNDVLMDIRKNIDKIRLNPNPLTQLIRLRQATGYTGILSSSIKESAKFDRLLELMEEIDLSGHKAIIFSNWTNMTDQALTVLKSYNPAVITGETKDREAQKDKFMTDPTCKAIIGTIGAMGTGLTLTAANTVIFLDSPWNRANKEQAEDRAHRIGTKSNVTIITLVCKDTIDERIEDIVHKKGKIADLLVDGEILMANPAILDYLIS